MSVQRPASGILSGSRNVRVARGQRECLSRGPLGDSRNERLYLFGVKGNAPSVRQNAYSRFAALARFWRPAMLPDPTADDTFWERLRGYRLSLPPNNPHQSRRSNFRRVRHRFRVGSDEEIEFCTENERLSTYESAIHCYSGHHVVSDPPSPGSPGAYRPPSTPSRLRARLRPGFRGVPPLSTESLA